MAEIEKGFVAPNSIGWGARVVPHLRYLGVKRLQVLIFEQAELQIADLVACKQAVPDLEFFFRFYAENIITFDPRLWIKEVVRRLRILLQAGIRPKGVVWINEPNIEAPDDLKRDWVKQALWHQDTALEWESYDEALGIENHLGALSPQDPEWEAGLSVYAAHYLDGYYFEADAHCYPGSEDAWRKVRAAFPELRVSVTEFNQMDPVAFAGGLDSAVVDDFYWFIIFSDDPQWGYVTLVGSQYYESFKNAIGGSYMGTAHDLYDDWYSSLSGEGFNPATALGKHVVDHPEINFGLPTTGERLGQLNGTYIVWRGYTNGILLVKAGDWDNVVWKPNPREVDLESPFP